MFLNDDYMPTGNKMSIAEIAYEKYVLTWTFKNIDRQAMEDTYARYNEYLIINDEPLTFDEYTEKYGYAAGRCAKYAEFCPSQGAWALQKADLAQARYGLHAAGAAAQRGIPAVGGQRAGRALRARRARV